MRQESVSARRSGDSSLLRRLNVSAALGAFLETESLTLRELRSAIGVSRPTAEEVLADLVAQQRIEEAPPSDGERRAGRPARRFRLRASSGYVLGADIGAHKVMVAITDLRGNVLALRRRRVEPQQSARSRLGVVRTVIQSALGAAGLDPSDLDGAACGVVGALRADSQVLDVQRANMGADLHPYSLPGFGDVDAAAELAEHLGRPVLVANDVKVAALAERWQGAAQDADDIVYMFAGQRLGAGVLIGGQVHQGRHGAAGEVGTLPMLGWESAMQHLEAVATRLGPSGDTDIERVFAAAAGGGQRAIRVVDEIARALALGAATLVASVDPELVVLGGGMSRAGALIAEPFTRHLTAMCLFEPHVVTSTMGDESVALGAVRLALDHVQRQLLDVDDPVN